MIADDPVTDPDNEYIFHTEKPRFFAKRVEEDEEVAYIDIVEEIDNVEEYFHGEPEKNNNCSMSWKTGIMHTLNGSKKRKTKTMTNG